ncbi:MAG: J domain-containing protein [Bacteroidota bacterium]
MSRKRNTTRRQTLEPPDPTEIFDLYEVLGVSRDADAETIRTAFRARAKVTHPDAGGSPGAFEHVKLAQQILLDPERRARYDATGRIDRPALDRTESNALSMLGELLTQILGQGDEPGNTDSLAAMRSAIKESLENMDKQVADAKAARDRIMRMKTKFRLRKKGADPIAAILDAKAREVDRMLADSESARRIHERALEILANYEFEFTPQPGRSPWIVTTEALA